MRCARRGEGGGAPWVQRCRAVKGGRRMGGFWTLLFRFSFGLLCHSAIFYLWRAR